MHPGRTKRLIFGGFGPSGCWAGLLGLVLFAPYAWSVAADHPLIGRFEHAEIIDYEQNDFDEYTLLAERYTGSAEWGESGREAFGRELEGKITRITHEAGRRWSTLEIMRAYPGYVRLQHRPVPKSWGVGFTAPVAPNDSDTNRAMNRRVELVEW